VPQIVKIPHLRNAYAKIGMFGTPAIPFVELPDSGSTGPQVRGFGFMGDGSEDTVFRCLNASVFAPTAQSGFPQTNTAETQRDVEQFVLAFVSDPAPIVGQQVTLASTNAKAAGARVTLLEQRGALRLVSDASLRALAGSPGQEVTFLAATPGSGPQLAYSNTPVSVTRRR
jgi:hypothetical protein